MRQANEKKTPAAKQNKKDPIDPPPVTELSLQVYSDYRHGEPGRYRE